MAVVLYSKMPGADLAMIKAVSEEMDVYNDPPDGMIVHTVIEVGGVLTIMDVWESAEAMDKFEADRLNPAFERVAKRMGIDPTQMPEPQMHKLETLDLILGR